MDPTRTSQKPEHSYWQHNLQFILYEALFVLSFIFICVLCSRIYYLCCKGEGFNLRTGRVPAGMPVRNEVPMEQVDLNCALTRPDVTRGCAQIAAGCASANQSSPNDHKKQFGESSKNVTSGSNLAERSGATRNAPFEGDLPRNHVNVPFILSSSIVGDIPKTQRISASQSPNVKKPNSSTSVSPVPHSRNPPTANVDTPTAHSSFVEVPLDSSKSTPSLNTAGRITSASSMSISTPLNSSVPANSHSFGASDPLGNTSGLFYYRNYDIGLDELHRTESLEDILFNEGSLPCSEWHAIMQERLTAQYGPPISTGEEVEFPKV